MTFEFYSADEITTKTLKQRESHKKRCDENETQYPFSEGGWNNETIIMGWSPAGYGFAVECETCEKAVPHFFADCNYAMKLTRDYVSYLEAVADLLKTGSFDSESETITLYGWGEHTGFKD